jgi:tetratricopeptide (TPR) repeat protein
LTIAYFTNLGHAWIYERATGVVSSLLYADSSTCNGIIPHPTLPIFVTYGIDPTAKVWRATNPVDRDADDSPLGRARSYHKQEYTKSPIVQNYNCVAMSMAMDVDTDDDTTTGLLPDQLPPSDNANGGSITMGGILFQRRRFGLGSGAYSIGNNLRNLPAVLQKNYYDCAVAETKGEDKPVQSGLRELHRRISNIRLRHQADQRGLVWNSSIPWVFGSHKRYTVSKVINENMYGNPVDLIPDFPSDWIPFDPEMSPSPLPCGTHFNLKDHEGFYAEKFAKGPRGGDDILPTRKHPWLTGAETGPSVVTPEKKIGSTSRCKDSDDEEKEPQSASDFDVGRALHFLHETALLLKTGGNAALEAGSIREAARRYDRAIKYCSVALMDCGARNEAFHDQTARRWTPITKVLIMARLNLCMVLTRLEDTKGALDQATLAQQELGPFSKQRGKVLAGSRLEIVAREDEPDQTFLEAKELEAKACFRLGCVLMKRTEYEEAIESFEESISCTKEISKETEPSVLRRLAEAKREHTRKSKRQRKKFKRMFES